MNGATMLFLNYNGDTIGNQALNGNMVQTITVATYPPSATATPTASVSMTSSASNSFGITPSVTASLTPSASVSGSALSNYPIQARVYTAASGQCLNFVEVRFPCAPACKWAQRPHTNRLSK